MKYAYHVCDHVWMKLLTYILLLISTYIRFVNWRSRGENIQDALLNNTRACCVIWLSHYQE